MGPIFPRGNRAAVLLTALCFVIPFSIAAIEILFPVLLLAWCVERLPGWKAFRAAGPANQRIVLYSLLAYTLFCAWSITQSSFPRLSIEAWIGKTAEYSLIFLIAWDLSALPGAGQRNYQFIQTACWLVLAYCLLQEISIYNPWHNGLPIDPIMHRPLNYLRMTGPYKNPNDLATFLMVAALLFVGDRNNRILALLLTFCLVWTKSLGAVLGFSVGAAFLALQLQGIRRRWKLLGLCAGLLIVFAGFLALEPRIRDVFTLSDLGSQDRLRMWKIGWRMAMDRPWIGHGLNTFMANYQRYSPDPNQWPAYAHNCFLQIFAETGISGLLIFLAFLGSLFFSTGRFLFRWGIPAGDAGRESALRILSGLMAGITAYLVQSFFDTNLYALRQAVLFWSWAGMALGLCRLLSNASRSSS